MPLQPPATAASMPPAAAPPPTLPADLGSEPLPDKGFREQLLEDAAAAPATTAPAPPATAPTAPTTAAATDPKQAIDAQRKVAPLESTEPLAPLPDAKATPVGLRGSFATLDDAMGVIGDLQQQMTDLDGRVARGEVTYGSAEYQALSRRLHAGMMNAQIMVGNAQLGVELMSKVVEHGTSGMRTVLQTQA